ncbi:family 16 glycosylhydrolase [Dankookia sp. GCM10030260]|uniref:family 16 glycosylhydrolase n=1 Tax=Dankookia sp. GCM10030260 TaxID=3273390 RepID=UPI003609823C
MIHLNALSRPLATSASPTNWYSSTLPGATVTGGGGADWLSATDPAALLQGGAGDDTYAVWDNRIAIVEAAAGGIDTVQSWAGRQVLPAHVENLQLMRGAQSGLGNALDNILTGSAGADSLDGGAGNDVLTGGAGPDAFTIVRGNGSDAITDFAPGTDTIRLQGHALFSFAAVRAAMTQTGADTTIALGGGEKLVLRNTLASSLTARDVWLPADPQHFGMTQTFAEEFDSFSASASGLGTTWKTTYKINDQLRTLSSNKEAQYYSDASVGVDPFSLAGGVLDIAAAPGSNPLGLPYNSGLITTARSFAQRYGYFEARVDLPAGKGFWPAFWLLPADGTWPPEIDIFEVLGDNTTTAYATLRSTSAANTTFRVNDLPDLSAGFHTFGLSWQADTIRWFIDGQAVAEAATPADMHIPMYLLLNLAVGDAGSWPGQYAPGMPTGHMQIDYVRAWQYGGGTVTGPGDVAAFGGSHTLKADGVSDLYDFSRAAVTLTMDASGLSTAGTHTIWGSPLGSLVRGGPGNVNFAGGIGDDTFVFGNGLSRVKGGGGNDSFVIIKGGLVTGDLIIDFHLNRDDGGEHDTLRLLGFGSDARLEFVAGSGTIQTYQVVDGDQVSGKLQIQIANGSGHLGSLDVVFG